MAVQTVKIKFFPKQHIPAFIQNGNQMKLIMLVSRTKRELRIIFEDLVVAPTCDSKETLSCRWELFNCEKGYLPDKPDESLPDF